MKCARHNSIIQSRKGERSPGPGRRTGATGAKGAGAGPVFPAGALGTAPAALAALHSWSKADPGPGPEDPQLKP